MYSLVVLMALGTAGETPDYYYGGCGYSYGGYCGYSYSGCGYGYGGYCGYSYGHCGYGYVGHCGYAYPCHTYAHYPVYSYGCFPKTIVPMVPKKDDKPPVKVPPEKEISTATIVVNLPANAKLTFDGASTMSTASTRIFVTPELEPGTTYSYVVKAEVMKDGKPVVLGEQKVTFRVGETKEITLTEPVSGVAAQ